jgi:nucleoid-associated protein YgaU
MGLFDFLKNAGRKLNPGQEAQEIKDHINRQLPGQIDGLNVSFDGSTAKLFGQARSQSAREKAVLLAGNHDGVDRVDDGMTVSAQTTAQQTAATQQARAEQQAAFYTIQKGDSLSKVAKEKYGDANAWRDLFEANREVIEDPDKIYPGQTIRIPARG